MNKFHKIIYDLVQDTVFIICERFTISTKFSTWDWNEVTCKRCLKLRQKYE